MAVTYENYYRNQRNKHDIVLATYKDAGEVLHKLVHLIETYGHASVADLYDLVGMPNSYSNVLIGWSSYQDITIKRCREGYLLSLPDATKFSITPEERNYCFNDVNVTKALLNSFYGVTGNFGRRNGKQDMLDSMLYGYAAKDRALQNAKPFVFQLEITNVIYNDPATIVFWSDNTKTIVKATNEKFDPEKGLAMAIAKKYYGNQGNYFNHLKKWIPSHKPVVSKAKHKVGDQISFDLKGFGHYTATAQKVNDDGSAMFLFDTILPEERCMNDERTNAGGFGKSDLKKWIDTKLLPAFPDDIRDQIREITIPTVGQIFGKDEWCEDVFVPDQDEQWPLMKTAEGRRAKRNGDYDWYWLQNATKKDVSAADFASVGYNGNATYHGASTSNGVRPCLVIEPLRGDKEETHNA